MLDLPAKQMGVTLLEIIIALVVVSVMITLSIPAVSGWADHNRLKATADAIIDGLQLAKMEAVRRNTLARFVLTDTPSFTAANGGQAGDWEVCISDTGSYLNNKVQGWAGTEVGTPAKIGMSTVALANQNFATPLAAGAGLTGYVPPLNTTCAGTTVANTNANVTFDAMGRVSNTNIVSNITRIDILPARAENAKKRLVIIINPQGQIKMCNPASQDVNQQCS